MRRDSWAFLISGTLFGFLLGWIVTSQRTAAPVAAAPTSAAAAAPDVAPPPPPLDERKATDLQQTATREPGNAAARVELANLYYDAERYDLAIPWYEAAVKLNSKDIDASTDLGLCYYFTGQVDRALARFDASLAVNPRHLKTLLNQGVVRAFGKQDLPGAMQSWQKVVDIAPDSEEAKQAKKALSDMQSGHATLGSGGRSGGP
jgi:tetratricopeptide (TPR) repeat protein